MEHHPQHLGQFTTVCILNLQRSGLCRQPKPGIAFFLLWCHRHFCQMQRVGLFQSSTGSPVEPLEPVVIDMLCPNHALGTIPLRTDRFLSAPGAPHSIPAADTPTSRHGSSLTTPLLHFLEKLEFKFLSKFYSLTLPVNAVVYG